MFDVNDSFTGDYPNIEIVVNPDSKKQEPKKSEEKTAHKGGKVDQELLAEFIKEKSGEEIAAEKKKYHKENYRKVGKDIEPVTVNDHQNFFPVFLPLKMIVGKFMFHN
ncbi:MAG: hypothetical protein A2489_02165 [Candidatus Moranbacteria bacterium RIFOXYC12_FULL_36_13]|nr:MAG: hypothetical protein A2489_02165 [Candidatus Moranbacteria bacterium RIFOXYC12_FULL_36_13]